MDVLALIAILFADDTILLADSPKSFKKCLDDFEKYCKQWKLTVNIDKTKVIIFGTNKRAWHKYSFKINNKLIEIVDTNKYLGTYFSHSGSFFLSKNTY